MRALYGVDTTLPQPVAGGGIVGDWVDPGDASSGYTYGQLTGGTTTLQLTAAQLNLRRIVAVRIGLILRTSLRERDPVPAATTLTLFGDAVKANGTSLAQATSSTTGSAPSSSPSRCATRFTHPEP
jgi:type IV pilus assembly protein PilW